MDKPIYTTFVCAGCVLIATLGGDPLTALLVFVIGMVRGEVLQ